MQISEKIKKEIASYFTETVPLSNAENYSQRAELDRIARYRNRIYPTGKLDDQDNYKYWFDIIQPKIDGEVKNVDFDRANVFLHSDAPKDATAVFVLNASLKQWMRDTGQGEAINASIEAGAAEGNVVWKETENGYEKMDLQNLYVIITTAETLNDTPVVERHLLSQSQVRKMRGAWDSDVIDDVLKNCGNKSFNPTGKNVFEQKTEIPFYEIFERNGEVSTKELKQAQGKKGGNDDEYVLAKVVCAGLGGKGQVKDYILFAEEIDYMPYCEYHRGPYKGKWLREGLVSLLLDIQTRINKIGNEMALGLEWASKVLFRSGTKRIAQNMLTDLMNGDVLQSEDLQQVPVRMDGFDQLANEWNRLLDLANRIANSFEVAAGEALPSGTPLGAYNLLNQNTNKFYGYLQEKFALAYAKVIENMLPEMVKDIKAKEIITITGDDKYLKQYYEMVINSWYLNNLVSFPPHTEEQARVLKDAKMQELTKAKKEAKLKLEQGLFTGVLKRLYVVITSENYSPADTQTLIELSKIEQDTVRRTAMLELVGQRSVRGVDFSSLPKSAPQPAPMPSSAQAMPNPQMQPAMQ